jgi:tRNA U34 5-methylaminomethyl-2-thiouridine-forming methyltransferase MnmC
MYHNPDLIFTKDGSHTIFLPELNEHYHSVHGAIRESLHVYIHSGFDHHPIKNVKVLEVGFGTGLNVLLTLKQAMEEKRKVIYHTIDKFILPEELTGKLNYDTLIGEMVSGWFQMIHVSPWNREIPISDFFTLMKILTDLKDTEFNYKYDIVYFDAFGPDKQPEMWTMDIFKKIFEAMNPGGILTTYSSKGEVRRKMEQCGFSVEKLPGPAGKREMLRCTRV